MNLFDLFLQTATRQPDHPLIITATETHTYGAFLIQIEALVTKLKAHGIGPGQCIGLHYPNSPAYIRLTYAIWGCGACVVPIPVELSAPEKADIFHNIAIDAVLSKPALLADLAAIQATEPCLLTDEAILCAAKRFRDHPAGFAAVNAAFVRFSSGTTGAAKGVVLSHETIYARIEAANQGLQLGPHDRVVWLLSMAYHFAVSIVAYLSYGVTILLCPNTFGITIIRTAAKYQATIIYAAPTHYALMTNDRSGQLLPDVRLAIVTTTALPAETAAAFYARFQIPLNETYGIIEIGLPCINLGQPWAKQGSVGQVLPAYELRLEQGAHEPGLGAILLRGQGMVDAYYEPWQPRGEILAHHQGWFATGDIGEVDAEGYLFIRGRSKEVISVGGMKFFPQEVESVLEAHPAIQQACVFRYPDKRLGDVPHAHVVLNPAFGRVASVEQLVDELRDFCAARLAQHKVPKDFQFVAGLLRTASGKLLRNYAKLLSQETVIA